MPISHDILNKIMLSKKSKEDIVLSDCEITDNEINLLLNTIQANANISEVTLDLSFNLITNAGADKLAQLIKIKELNLSSNNLDEKCCLDLTKTSLIKFDVSSNLIYDAVINFKLPSSLTELIMAECKTTDVGATKLFSNSHIKMLDLSTNNISGQCLKHLPVNGALEKLNLTQNRLSPIHLKYLVENRSLIYLDLTGTFIGDDGAIDLSKNEYLQELILAQCFIKDNGAQNLSQNKHLRILDLFNNYVTAEGASYFVANTSLLNLDLSNNSSPIETNLVLKEYYEQSQNNMFVRTEEFILQLKDEKKRTIRSKSAPVKLKQISENPDDSFVNASLSSNDTHTPSPKNSSKLSPIDMEANNNQKQTFLFQSKRTQRTHSDDDEKDVDSKKQYSPITDRSYSNSNDNLALSLEKTNLSTDGETTPIHRNSI